MHFRPSCPPVRRLARLAELSLLGVSGLLIGIAAAPEVAFAADQEEQNTEARAAKTATATPAATPTPRSEPTRQRAAASRTPTAKPTLSATPTATLPPSPTPTAENEAEAVEEQPPSEAVQTQLEGAEEWFSEQVAVEPEPVEPAPPPRVVRPAVAGRSSDGLSLHVLRYLPLILGAAEMVDVDPAVLAALMEVEGSGEDAVSPAGALGLMQLMPDKLVETDDPFDPGTNILRAAELVRRLTWSWNGDLAAVAGAYFGAVDAEGNITDISDGIVDGIEYVTRFADAYERWATALDQPLQVVVIRPRIRQRSPPPPEADLPGAVDRLPDRDRWYLELTGPRPVILPIYY